MSYLSQGGLYSIGDVLSSFLIKVNWVNWSDQLGWALEFVPDEFIPGISTIRLHLVVSLQHTNGLSLLSLHLIWPRRTLSEALKLQW